MSDTRWSLYDKVTSKIIKQRQKTPGTADGSLPVGLDTNLAWLVESLDAEPTFDPDTQRLEPSETITIDAGDTRTGTRVFTYTPVPLNSEQLKDKERQARMKNKSASVKTIAAKFQNNEAVKLQDVAEIISYIVDRDALDR